MLSRIQKLIAKQEVLLNDLEKYKQESQELIAERHAAEEARIILQLAAKKTQEQLEVHFSDLVTKAFKAVLRNPYNFSSKFIERRNKTECDLRFERDGVYYKPKFTTGGGVIDLASFALRIAYWRLEKTAPVIILDEPMKMVSKNLIPKIAELVKLLSVEFEIQFLIITHIPELAETADALFVIENGKLAN